MIVISSEWQPCALNNYGLWTVVKTMKTITIEKSAIDLTVTSRWNYDLTRRTT